MQGTPERTGHGALAARWSVASPQSNSSPIVRQFEDARGITWRVRERSAAAIPHARAPTVLQFESEQGWRLVWDFPGDWHTLSSEALEALGRSH